MAFHSYMSMVFHRHYVTIESTNSPTQPPSRPKPRSPRVGRRGGLLSGAKLDGMGIWPKSSQPLTFGRCGNLGNVRDLRPP